MITIPDKSRYFSASPELFPSMERNFAWLFGLQTPEQGWKTTLAVVLRARARGSAAMERRYIVPVDDDGEPLLFEDDFLADLMQAYLDRQLPGAAPAVHPFAERQAAMRRLFPLKHTKEFYTIRTESVVNAEPGVFTRADYIHCLRHCACNELLDHYGPHDSALDCYFRTVFRKINRIGAERFSREAELLADLAVNDITAEARSLYDPWAYYCQAAFRDLAWA